MAWIINAAFLCFVLRLSLVEADFLDAVYYVFHNAEAIRLLFLRPTKFYVVGGTFEKDPLLPRRSGIPFKCGQVETKQRYLDQFYLERWLWTDKLKDRRWFNSTYAMIPGTSTGYDRPNYMDAYRIYGRSRFTGRIYLLLSDFHSCALFYHATTGDCELWERKRPGIDGLPSSFCSVYIPACNNKTVNWYYNYT
uniref:Putative secreted protein n=1 Tax=Ixodes ricinus TaxID=34613 RepID=A0A090X9J1_IXORI